MSQNPQHYAFISASDSLELPDGGSTSSQSAASASPQDLLVALYQSYAEKFPNPKLIKEYQERDQLLQATSAAHSAAHRTSQQQQAKQHSSSWLGFLFGTSGQSNKAPQRVPAYAPPSREEDEWLTYTEVQDDDETVDETLCGTNHSLDRSCIPQDAHSMARLLMASSRTRGERPHVVKSSPFLPSDVTISIVGLGMIADWKADPTGENKKMTPELATTSDREDLITYAATGSFDLSLVRAVCFGSNCLLVSWGFSDGVVVFYRRIDLPNSSIGWEAVVFLGPSNAVLEHSFDVFADDDNPEETAGSDLLRVSDMVPMVLSTPGLPAAALAVSRLGGYMEVLPLPLSLWNGPSFPSDRHRPRKTNKKGHYAKKKMVDVSSEHVPIPIVAITTVDYHIDIICLESIRTSKRIDSAWDQEFYPKSPPAEYTLVASGCSPEVGHEILTFWAITFVFVDEPPNADSAGFTLSAVLQEAVDVDAMGAEMSVFANRAILNQWRQPRKVALKERPAPAPTMDEHGEPLYHASEDKQDRIADNNKPITSVYDRVTTITTSAPIVAMQAIVVLAGIDEDGVPNFIVMLSLLDWNGGVTLMDCSLFERMTSHSLSDDEYEVLYGAEIAAAEGREPPPLPDIPLVKTIMDRSKTLKLLRRVGYSAQNRCVSVQWLARVDAPADPWLLLLTHNCAETNNIMIISGLLEVDQDNPVPKIQKIPFPTSRATLQGTVKALVPDVNGNDFAPPLRILFSPKPNSTQLSFALLQPLQPREIIIALTRDGKYEEAINAALQLSSDEQTRVAKTLEDCRVNMWEKSLDLKWLRQVRNDSFVIQQALSLFAYDPYENDGCESEVGAAQTQWLDNIDLGICRGICELALERTSKIRLASALALGQGGDDAKGKLQNLLVRLGTYELLCQSLNVEASFDKFREIFFHVPTGELAKSFASAANVAALSILWFRHSKELLPFTFDILHLLPLTLRPKEYCFLLPMGTQTQAHAGNGRCIFVSDVPPCDGEVFLHVSQFPSYMQQRLGIHVVINKSDEQLVLENNSTTEHNADDCLDDKVAAFYQSRATDMQHFVASLQDIAGFSAIGLLALGTSSETMDTDPPSMLQGEDEVTKSIFRTWGCAKALQRMLSESVDDFPPPGLAGDVLDLSPFATVTPLNLWGMNLEDIVAMVIGGQDDTETIYEIYKQHLVPLLKYLQEEQDKNLDDAICKYCVKLFQPKGAVSKESVGAPIQVVKQELWEGVKVCAAIAFGSRTSIKKSDRIIRDKGVLAEFVIRVVFAISNMCRDAEIGSEKCVTLVKCLWDMYETLPADATETSNKADVLFQDLAGLDILSRWPGCQEQAFSFVLERFKLRDIHSTADADSNKGKLFIIGQKSVASLCRSFCSQTKSQKGAVGLQGLLRDLISDIKQIHEVCYESDDAFVPLLKSTLSSDLIDPLSRLAEFELVAQLLTGISRSWWDEEQECRTVRAYVDTIVFSDNENHPHAPGDHSLQAAIACQDSLGPVFPTLQSDFQLSRRYLDAAHFINTSIFAELKMPKTIKPNDLKDELPLDVVESILKAIPTAIIIGCKEWGEEPLAIHANKALRDYHERSTASPDHVDETNLPPIPGGAIFHLAGIFGLEDTSSVLVVKSRVIHYGAKAGYLGAAAAVCRTLLTDQHSFSSDADSLARVAAVAEVVTCKEYGDDDTKRELCLSALRRYSNPTSIFTCQHIDSILSVCTSLELRANQGRQSETRPQLLNLPPPPDSIGSLHKDSWSQYSVNVYDLFWNLQQQSLNFLIDDSLLNALSRYVFFSCIFRSTRPRATYAGKIEKAATNELLVFGAAILLHINRKENITIPAIKELRQIVEQQTMAVINQHPTAFEDPFVFADEAIVSRLEKEGFPKLASRRAALATKNSGFPQALQFIIQHIKNPRLHDPIVNLTSPRRVFAEKASIQQILNTFGFAQQFLSDQKSVQEWIKERPVSFSDAEPRIANRTSKASEPADTSLPEGKVLSPQNKQTQAVSEAKPIKISKSQAEQKSVEQPRTADESKPSKQNNTELSTAAIIQPAKAPALRYNSPATQLADETDASEMKSPIPTFMHANSKHPPMPVPANSNKPQPIQLKKPEGGPRNQPTISQMQPAPILPISQRQVPNPPQSKAESKPLAPPAMQATQAATEPKPRENTSDTKSAAPQTLADVVTKTIAPATSSSVPVPSEASKTILQPPPPPSHSRLPKPKDTESKNSSRFLDMQSRNLSSTVSSNGFPTSKASALSASPPHAKSNVNSLGNGTRPSSATSESAKPPQPPLAVKTHPMETTKERRGPSNLEVNTTRPSPTAQSTLLAGVPFNSTGKSMVTPSNLPKSNGAGPSTGGTTGTDRPTLRQRGEAAMEATRTTPRSHDQNLDERKRLIEAGRRLLAKSRANTPSSLKASPATRTSQGTPSSTALSASAVSTKTSRFFGSGAASKATRAGESVDALKGNTLSLMVPAKASLGKVAKLNEESKKDVSQTKSSQPFATQASTTPGPTGTAGKGVTMPVVTHNDPSHVPRILSSVPASRPMEKQNPFSRPLLTPATKVAGSTQASNIQSTATGNEALKFSGPSALRSDATAPRAPTLVPAKTDTGDSQTGWDDDLGDIEGEPQGLQATGPPYTVASTTSKGPISKQGAPPPPPPPEQPALPKVGVVSCPEVEEGDDQGGWGDNWDDDLGDIESETAAPGHTGSVTTVAPARGVPHAAVSASGEGPAEAFITGKATDAPPISMPPPASARVQPEGSESQGGWGDNWDDDLGDIESEVGMPTQMALPNSKQTAPLPRDKQIAPPLKASEPEGSESQVGWGDNWDDGLGDIGGDFEPSASIVAPAAIKGHHPPLPAGSLAGNPNPNQASSAGDKGGWDFDGDDGLDDIEGGPGENGGWGFDDPENTGGAKAETKLNTEGDDGGWDFEDF